ncbi:VanZ family protein [Bacillus alkalicellulosilyticus]|uniref:VanZ family protein n=1 Tax=Alkalihalobacterium alkalicellulosilyticum TaxID=1912214 RepID=UPI0009981E52|nr:VanZ family protein [Bacillus alkalicellulosilyticus]
MRKIIVFSLAILLVSIIVLVFHLTSQPYSVQDLTPRLLSYDLSWVHHYSAVSFSYGGQEISLHSLGEAHFFEFFIRKGAHVIAFAMIGFFAYCLFYFIYGKWSVGFAFLLVSVYAVFDEVRQYFHPERHGQLPDILLDIVGGCIGIGLALVVVKKFFFYYGRNSEPY